MCTKPFQIDAETKVACRECDACLSARKNDWVGRAMAEKAVAEATFVVTLTYRPLPNGDKPIGARVFRYEDVKKFFKNVRERYYRKYGVRGDLRYIIAGETGSKKGRVHWHVVIFSKLSLNDVGVWSDTPQYDGDLDPVDFEETEMEVEKRKHWSCWKHGHVLVQEPGERGIRYVLKYLLKDQFNVLKSKGNKRFSSAENYSASMFRMSKLPPIGWRFLAKKLEGLCAIGAVPPSVEVQIPDAKGFWWPRGQMRTDYLYGLHLINEKRKRETGKDCAQWSSLVHSVSQTGIEADLEVLLNGWQAEQRSSQGKIERDWIDFKVDFRKRQRLRDQAVADRKIVRRCGHITPCDRCAEGRSVEVLAELERERRHWFVLWSERYSSKDDELAERCFEEWWVDRSRISRGCKYRDDPRVVGSFDRYRRLRLLEARFAKLKGPKTERRKSEV
jgi:hypothetical protein